MSISTLIEECKQQLPRAQRQLYDLYKSRLMGVCRRYTRSKEDAQDVLQESFVRIFSKIEQIQSQEKLEGWMKQITVRTAINFYYKNKKQLQFSNEITEKIDFAGNDYELVLSTITDQQLLEIINTLPDGCRIVFNLHVIEGYSHVEIAKMMNISEGTSRSQFYYAKGILKSKLQKIGINCYEKYA